MSIGLFLDIQEYPRTMNDIMNDELTSVLVTSGIRTHMILQFLDDFFIGFTVSNLGILYT